MLTIPRPQIDLLKKKANEISQTLAKELGQKLTQLTARAMEKIIHEVNPSLKNADQKIKELEEQFVRLCEECINGPKIKIEISSRDIKLAQNSFKPTLINGKVIFSLNGFSRKLEVDCRVACGHWKNLDEITGTTIDLMDHLNKLLPVSKTKTNMKGPLSLVTYQNGMMNSLTDFDRRCDHIMSEFPEGPLFIGLYNPTTSFILTDLIRFLNESEKNALGVYSLCQMFRTFAELIPEMNPNLIWAHFAHSEAGLIANAAFKACERWRFNDSQKNIKKNIENHMIAATYGAVKPIADNDVLLAINNYAKNDIALFFGKNYLDIDLDNIVGPVHVSNKIYQGKKYTVKITESVTKRNPWLKLPVEVENGHVQIRSKFIFDIINNLIYSIEDHDFTNDSYREILKRDIKDFRVKFKIYSCKYN